MEQRLLMSRPISTIVRRTVKPAKTLIQGARILLCSMTRFILQNKFIALSPRTLWPLSKAQVSMRHIGDMELPKQKGCNR